MSVSNEWRKREDVPVWTRSFPDINVLDANDVTSLEAFVVSVSSELLKGKKISKERARSIKARLGGEP